MPSIFTRIIQGEIPCYKVAETPDFLAFLDIMPRAKGHTLCVPKIEVDYIFDLDDQTLAGLSVFSKKVARAIQQVVPCARIGVAVVGLEVPHTHIHLIPINQVGDLSFALPPLTFSPEEMQDLAARIAANV